MKAFRGELPSRVLVVEGVGRHSDGEVTFGYLPASVVLVVSDV